MVGGFCMNITEFVSKFTDLISYQFELSIGGKRKDEIVIDKSFISADNFKGKMIPSRKANGKLVPLQDVSLPINYQFQVDDSLDEYFVVYDTSNGYGMASFNPIDMTRKNGSKHAIRLLNEKGIKFGDIQLILNASGDITTKICSYTNSDFTHFVRQSVDIKYCDGKFKREESTFYKEQDLKNNIETVAQIWQVDGITTGVSIGKQRMNKVSDYLIYHLARTETPSDQALVSVPMFCHEINQIIQKDLIRFQGQFLGEYTGNTVLRTENSYLLVVRTSDHEFNYYTEIDLEGVDPLIGAYSSAEGNADFRDSEYFKRIQTSSKEPKFKTQMIGGVEQLVPKNGDVCSMEEIEAFEQFKNLYLESFDELGKMKVGKLMQKRK